MEDICLFIKRALNSKLSRRIFSFVDQLSAIKREIISACFHHSLEAGYDKYKRNSLKFNREKCLQERVLNFTIKFNFTH